jgi:hypothetical protein
VDKATVDAITERLYHPDKVGGSTFNNRWFNLQPVVQPSTGGSTGGSTVLVTL